MRLAIRLLAWLSVAWLAAGADAAGIISTIAGGGPPPVGPALGRAVAARNIAIDAAGNLFVNDVLTLQVLKKDASTGLLSVIGGSGNRGPCANVGDGGPATAACLDPNGVAVDAAGNVYVADGTNHRVRRIDPATGIITTFAGGGTSGIGDGGPATSATLGQPFDLAFDPAGNLFISDPGPGHRRVRRVDAVTGTISTVSTFSQPAGIAFDGSDLYVVDQVLSRIYRLANGALPATVVAGNGVTDHYCPDGGQATATCLDNPLDVTFDQAGRMVISEADNRILRRVDFTTGIITTIAGHPSPTFVCDKTYGDGGPAIDACLAAPGGLASNAAGDLLIGDYGVYRVRRIDAATGTIAPVMGNGDPGFCGDGGPATDACLDAPYGVARDASGNLFIVDTYNGRIRRVDATTNVITTVAGSAYGGFFQCPPGPGPGDGGPATDACLAAPTDVAVDANGDVLVPDSSGVRRVDHTTGIITTAYGNGGPGYCGDGGPASVACFGGVIGLAVDQAGNVYLADAYNYRVRRVDAITGIITTVAGNGQYDTCGDGGLATDACMFPIAVAVDAAGNLFVADFFNGSRVRRVDAQTQIITRVMGGGTAPCVEGGPATNDCFSNSFVTGIAVDVLGNLFVSDGLTIRRVDAGDGTITTVAGNGSSYAFCGDGGPATSACIGTRALVVDPDGALIITDVANNRIRRVTCDGPDTDGDGRCDAYDFDEVGGMSMRKSTVKRAGRKGRVDFDLDVDTAPYSSVGDPTAFFAQARVTGFTIRALASAAPPELNELVVVAETPDLCRFMPVGAPLPARVRCKTKGLVRSRFRMSQTDLTGGYRITGSIRVPQIGVPTSGTLRLVVSVNGPQGRDYEAAGASCTTVAGKRPTFVCDGP